MLQTIIAKIESGQRIDGEEFLCLAQQASLHQLGFLAHAIRMRLHPEPLVTYVIDRNINYTDVCISACKFCAFFKAPEEGGGGVLTKAELAQKIAETQALGGTQILLQGGLHPDLPLEFYEDMLRFMKATGIHIHGFSPPEIVHFSRISGCSVTTVIKRLMAAGLDSIPGGGAEILSNRVRRELAPNKCDADQWIEVMATAHDLGLRTTATMMFGHIETMAERLEHLQRVRDLQDKTNGFTAFIPWPFQPDHTPLAAARAIDKTTAISYLRILALSRIFLDNVPNIQASWVTQGPKIAQLSLFFGANDFGSTMIEENVVAAAGVRFRLSEEEIRRLVTDAGFTPRQRLMDYTLV
ncbi:MAG: dehypoxanthine futalosine cyclase [Desulfobulbus sp.]|jgi:cyclic dehypoxanthinyl futalosine synthase|uniref:cyclic dehypoxanthinyl futalosine synthase n=1 Tax=Desulfobulbus sp. TaxID=895 RepID=UPI00283C8D47|nr:cyclic dehypoxanthinyl futalosine synthase [Desulfobulbus sp.]MDR2549256.1 dehypoxanthine futalosine cyclase [Desulfobulbus sp.]